MIAIPGRVWSVFIMLGWLFLVAPDIEGKLAPVITGSDITRAVEYEGEGTVFYATAKQQRECSYEGSRWVEDMGGETRELPVVYERTPRVKKDMLYFGPSYVDIPRASLVHNSFAIMYFKCHPLWLTASRFYP